MKSARRTILLLLAAACTDAGPVAPKAGTTHTFEALAAIAPTANPTCTVHWAAGVAGSWFDANRWSPAGVPGPTASVCIDAPGTYLVTLDPTDDATPASIASLDIGAVGATPTLRLGGGSATLNVAQGIGIVANATLDIRTTGPGIVNAQGTVTNLGTFSAVAPCGGCGTADALNADVINQGTLSSSAVLTLGKVNGAYQNRGSVTLVNNGTIVVPASAGGATFSQDAGDISGGANFSTLTMASGTFTMNGGRARTRSTGNAKPVVVLDGANLVIAPTATDSASLGVIGGTSAGRTVTGDVPPLMRLWLAGPVGATPGSIGLAGNPTNNGTILLVRQIDAAGADLTLTGAGRLTNAAGATIDATLNSGFNPTFHFGLDVTNNGSWLFTTGSVALDKPGGAFINTGTISLGPTSSVFVLRVLGSTLTNSGSVSGGSLSVGAGGRLIAAGNSPTHLTAVDGGIIEPGMPTGLLSVYTFSPTATGVLRVELGGTTAGTNYDQLDPGPNAFFAGTLDIVETNGFLAGRCGQSFDVVTHTRASGTGTFATVNGLNPGAGRMLRLIYVNATATTRGAVRLVGFDGSQKICVGPNPVSLTEGGAAMQYAMALDHQPTANVTVSATADAQVTVSPASVTFTPSNWQMPQYVTVTAVDDAAAEGTHSGTVTHAVATTDATYQGFVPSALTATITDNDTNLNPIAGNDGATTAEDTPVTVAVLANDSDPEGATLSVTAASAGAHGSTQIVNGGTAVRYTPAPNYNGSDTFSYTVSDGTRTATGTVNITITGTNDPPTAVSDQARTRTRRAVAVMVLANDADPDGSSLTVTQVTTPAHGSATIASDGQSITYQSVARFAGSDQFTYTITDGSGATATATVSVTVIDPSQNSAPIAVNDAAQMTRSAGSVRIMVLDNDSDPDGDAIAISSISSPSHGGAVILGRSIVYTIGSPAAGSDQFSYTVRDAFGGVATATVTVTWPVQGPDFRLLQLWGAGGQTRTVTGTPVANYVHILAWWSGSSNTPMTVELTLPPNTFSVGASDQPTRGLDLQPQENCTVIYSGTTPVRYRCTLPPHPGNSFITSFAVPPTATSITFTVTITPPLPDPVTANNSLTLTLSPQCDASYPARYQCHVEQP